MPSDSIGFCVASTRNGDGTGKVWPPIVTWRSCMTSSRADCTLAGARLISSASRKLPNTGPSSMSNEPVSGPEDAGADEVGGDEVGRELHAPERAAEHAGERADGQGLGQAGNALEQHVTLGEERDEQPLEHRVLADDHPLHLVERALERRAGLLEGVGARRLGRDRSCESVSSYGNSWVTRSG